MISEHASASDIAPEVYLLGEVTCGVGFGSCAAVACAYSLSAGDRWELLAGRATGKTHTAEPAPGGSAAIWSQPIDAHFLAGAMAVRVVAHHALAITLYSSCTYCTLGAHKRLRRHTCLRRAGRDCKCRSGVWMTMGAWRFLVTALRMFLLRQVRRALAQYSGWAGLT